MTLLTSNKLMFGRFGRQVAPLRVARVEASTPGICPPSWGLRAKARQVRGGGSRPLRASRLELRGHPSHNPCGTAHPRKRAWWCIGRNGPEHSKNPQGGTIRSEAPKSPPVRRYGERSQTRWAGGRLVLCTGRLKI